MISRDCGERRRLVASYRENDRMLHDGRIIEGGVQEVWSVCGKRRGHLGEHGPGSRLRRLVRSLLG